MTNLVNLNAVKEIKHQETSLSVDVYFIGGSHTLITFDNMKEKNTFLGKLLSIGNYYKV